MKSALSLAPKHYAGEETRAPATYEHRAVHRLPSRRVQTLFRIARLASAADAGLCCVRTMSDVRLTVDTGLELAVGLSVEIALSDDVTLGGVVERKDGQRAEIRFAHPIDSSDLLQSLRRKKDRRRQRPPRLEVDVRGMVFTEIGLQPVRVLNISQGGTQVSHDGSFRADQLVTILLRNLERRAVVRWAKDDKAGLTFLEPLSYRQLTSVNDFEIGGE